MKEKEGFKKNLIKFSHANASSIKCGEKNSSDTFSILEEDNFKRKFDNSEVEKSYKGPEDELERFVVKNIKADLNFWQKCLFFFLGFPPITIPLKNTYLAEGHFLKLKQANYYHYLGLASIVFAFFTSALLELVIFQGALIWCVLFFISVLFDDKFNREMLISSISSEFEILEENEENPEN